MWGERGERKKREHEYLKSRLGTGRMEGCHVAAFLQAWIKVTLLFVDLFYDF